MLRRCGLLFTRRGDAGESARCMRVRTDVLIVILASAFSSLAAHAGDLDFRPIERAPERLTELHPRLRWMKEQKIRAMWITDDLDEPFADSGGTKGQVMKDAGFNLVIVNMGPNTDDRKERTTMADDVPRKYDRRISDQLATRVRPNAEAARELGLSMFVGWKYGTHHCEPYRKYRSRAGALARWSNCPLDEAYIANQHIGRHAVRAARLGADGFNIDFEMYHSDVASYEGPCVCDDCFLTYLRAFAPDWPAIYDRVPAGQRGAWLDARQGPQQFYTKWGRSHYAAFAATRIEALWDGIRRRCHAINPTFVLSMYHVMGVLPGLERGLGTSTVPCPVFNASEYYHGPCRWSWKHMRMAAEGMPVLYLPGLYLRVQPPELIVGHALQSALYCDGYWLYYGTSLLVDIGPGESWDSGYGRYPGTSARAYLDPLTEMHARLAQLLKAPREQWPERLDGKHRWLVDKVAAARAAAVEDGSDEANKALGEAVADLERYEGYLRQDQE